MKYQNINDYELVYLIEEDNDDDAYSILYQKYEPLIRSMVKRFYLVMKKYGVDYDDLYQEAYIGFHSASKHFDDSNDVLFYTFACISIRNKLLNYYRSVRTDKRKITAYNISLFTDVGEGNELIHYICDENAITPLDIIEQEEQDLKLRKICLELDELEAPIFELRINGFSNKQISILLDIELREVSNHIFKIKKSLSKKNSFLN